jgi:hypothetical protein
MKAGLNLKTYDKPTPKIMRRIGDSLIIAGTTITGISAFTMPPAVTAVAAIITGLGKILTNCFEE